MRYDLIWKAIDEDISMEEKLLLNKELELDPMMKGAYGDATRLDKDLKQYFNEQPSASFLAHLKQAILEEFELPKVSFSIKPAIFVGLVMLLAASIGLIMKPDLFVIDTTTLPVEGTYIIYTIITFVGLASLYAFDLSMRRKWGRH